MNSYSKETDSFNQLIIDNSSFLEPFAFSLTHDINEAQDLVQDALHRALINKDKYKSGSNIKAWLYTIMRNIFINNYRKNKRFSRVSTDYATDYFLYQTNKVAKNDGIMLSGLQEIKAAINRLPTIFRLSFEMYYKGYKYQEIADSLKEPLGTIKSRIHFARKMLAKQIVR